MKGIDVLDVEPPVLMHFFQFTINMLEIALLDNVFSLPAERNSLSYHVQIGKKKQAKLKVTSIFFLFRCVPGLC